jgi:hypothetical protein
MHDKDSRKLVATGANSPWRISGTCVDYQVFVCDLPEFDDSGWESTVAGMCALGHYDTNACGVTTVRGDWGFFQIPIRGFPELKVTFFQMTRRQQQRRLLDALAEALRKYRGRS